MPAEGGDRSLSPADEVLSLTRPRTWMLNFALTLQCMDGRNADDFLMIVMIMEGLLNEA